MAVLGAALDVPMRVLLGQTTVTMVSKLFIARMFFGITMHYEMLFLGGHHLCPAASDLTLQTSRTVNISQCEHLTFQTSWDASYSSVNFLRDLYTHCEKHFE